MRFFLFSILFLQGFLMGATIQTIQYKGISIPVIFEKDTNLPTFNMQLIFTNAGYIKDGKNLGLANMTSAILNEGTKELGSTEFAQQLENKAIHLNVANGFETFVFELSSLKEFSEEGMSLLSRLLFSPNLTPKTLSKIKTLISSKIKRKENDFDFVANSGLNKILFLGTPFENENIGDLQSVNKITLKQINNFIHSNLTLNNLTIVCGGDVDFEEFKKSIEAVLANIEVGKKEQEPKPFTPLDTQVMMSISKPTEQAYVYFGSPFHISPNDKEIYLAKVASFILGGSGFGSRLMEEVRVKRGLAYSAYANISANKSYSAFTGHLQTKLESADSAIELVKQIVVDFTHHGVTQKELDGAKKFLSGSEPLRVETLSQRLSRAFFLQYKGLSQEYPNEELQQINNITLDEINNFIKKHTEVTKLSFFVVKK